MNLGTRALAVAAGTVASMSAWKSGPRLSILIFHRVPAEPDPLLPGEVCAARFDRMMSVAARGFRVLPLAEAARQLREGRLPARALCITFDDGYADNQEVALPILQRHGLPATFFVASGFLDGGLMFNDAVIECIRQTRQKRIDLLPVGVEGLATDSLAQRQAAISRLLPLFKYQTLAAREELLAKLRLACGNPPLPTSLMMSSKQVQALHAAGMEIGAHTVMHPILTELPDTQARAELERGRDDLQQLTQSPVVSLAYPNGRPGIDFDHRHVTMARELGFAQAVTTATGVSQSGDDPYQLPRFTPWDRSLPRWTLRLLLNQRQARFAVAKAPALQAA